MIPVDLFAVVLLVNLQMSLNFFFYKHFSITKQQILQFEIQVLSLLCFCLDHFIEPSPTKLSTTFIQLGNDSYMVLQKNLTWNEAKKQCELEGAHLASIRDLRAQSYIELQTSKLGQPLWIGLNSKEVWQKKMNHERLISLFWQCPVNTSKTKRK